MLGQVFGRLTVVAEVDPVRDKLGRIKYRKYLCQCTCGNTRQIIGGKLKHGQRKSCGCAKVERSEQVKIDKLKKKEEAIARKLERSANKKTQVYSYEAYLSKKQRLLDLKQISNEGSKCCIKCKLVKSVTEFHKDIFKSDGRRTECKECKTALKKQLRLENETVRAKDAEYSKRWVKANRDKLSAYRKAKRKDPIYRWRMSVRKRLSMFANDRRWTKTTSFSTSVGCSGPQLRAHLEALFTDGMSWDNRHEWHIDHIIPLSSAKTLEEMLKLNHYTNLQPLWAKDNLSKGSKVA